MCLKVDGSGCPHSIELGEKPLIYIQNERSQEAFQFASCRHSQSYYTNRYVVTEFSVSRSSGIAEMDRETGEREYYHGTARNYASNRGQIARKCRIRKAFGIKFCTRKGGPYIRY